MAYPTYQAAGALVESGTADVSPAWPTHQANDIALLVVIGNHANARLTTPQGFQELPVSPQRRNISTALDNNLTVYWKRATGASEAAPTVKFVADLVRAQIFTFRGCSTVGRPFTTVGGQSSASSTAVTFPALTTTEAESLIVDIVGHTIDSAGAKVSGWTNASLSTLTERADDSSTTGAGGGFAVHTGQKATAGAVNATTATLSTSSVHSTISLALTAVEQQVDRMPYLKAYGTPVESATANISPAWPAHSTGDVALLIVESGDWPVTLGTPAGFTEVSGSPQTGGVGGQSAATQLSVYWCRASSGAMGAPTVNFEGDHIRAMIVTFANVISAGDPVDVSTGSGTGGGSTTTTYTVPGGSTTVGNVLVVAVGSSSRDLDSRDEFSAWANADLRYVTERFDELTLIGNGSGIGFATGEKPTAGAFGATTATLKGATHQGRVLVGLKGSTGGGFDAEKGTFALTGMAAGLLHDRVVSADPGVFSLVGMVADFPVIQTFIIDAEPGQFSSVGFGVFLTKSSRGWRKQQERAETVWTKQPKLDLEN